MSWLLGLGKKPQQQENIPTSTEGTNSINNNDSITSTDDKTEQNKLTRALGFDSKRITNQASSLHDFAGLDKGVETLDLDEEKLSNLEGAQTGLLASRGWNDDLCYGTGAVYLSGLGLGGLYGFFEGVKKIPQGAPGKLQLNTVLNNITKRGPFLGNNAGVLAISYNLFNSTLGHYRGKHDHSNSVAAGFLSGALFKSTKGIKPMGYAGGLTALAAAAWCVVKENLA